MSFLLFSRHRLLSSEGLQAQPNSAFQKNAILEFSDTLCPVWCGIALSGPCRHVLRPAVCWIQVPEACTAPMPQVSRHGYATACQRILLARVFQGCLVRAQSAAQGNGGVVHVRPQQRTSSLCDTAGLSLDRVPAAAQVESPPITPEARPVLLCIGMVGGEGDGGRTAVAMAALGLFAVDAPSHQYARLQSGTTKNSAERGASDGVGTHGSAAG